MDIDAGFAILDSIPEMLCVFDPERRLAFANRVALEAGLIPELAQTETGRRLLRDAAENASVRIEHQHAATGKWYEISAHSSAQGVICLAHDITARKRKETESREREALLKSQLEAANIGAWEWFVRTNRVRWSDNMEAIHGQARGSFGGDFDGFLRGVLPADRENVLAAVRQALESRGDYQVEYRQLRADGAVGWMEGKGRVICDAAGEPERMIGVCMDVTERKRLEERLRVAAKMESLGVLAAGLAHDFNNLLVGILGNASLALHDVPQCHPLRQMLSEILRAGSRAAELTGQMLAFSGKGGSRLESVDLSRLVSGLGGLLRVSTPPHIELRFDLMEDLPRLQGDPSQLQQVVMNLVLNAVEAIGDAPGEISIATSARVVPHEAVRDWSLAAGEIVPGTCVALEVSDSGCGMDEQTQVRVFDPFFTTKFAGRGLGLAAAAGIVRSHGGTIQLRSDPGKGTTFTVLLAAAAREQGESRAAGSGS